MCRVTRASGHFAFQAIKICRLFCARRADQNGLALQLPHDSVVEPKVDGDELAFRQLAADFELNLDVSAAILRGRCSRLEVELAQALANFDVRHASPVPCMAGH